MGATRRHHQSFLGGLLLGGGSIFWANAMEFPTPLFRGAPLGSVAQWQLFNQSLLGFLSLACAILVTFFRSTIGGAALGAMAGYAWGILSALFLLGIILVGRVVPGAPGPFLAVGLIGFIVFMGFVLGMFLVYGGGIILAWAAFTGRMSVPTRVVFFGVLAFYLVLRAFAWVFGFEISIHGPWGDTGFYAALGAYAILVWAWYYDPGSEETFKPTLD